MRRAKDFDFTNTERTNNRNRTRLTNLIVGLGFGILTILSIITIYVAGKDNRFESAETVFNTIIPLIASWIGAVIAFYFGRDNYEAATEQVIALTRDTLDEISVENIMINSKTIVAQQIDQQDEATIDLSSLIELYNTIDKDRIPIFSSKLTARYIIHRSTMVEYKESKSISQPNTLTLGQMITENPKRFGYREERGFVTVAKNITLEKAIEEMNAVKDCQDIFVTDNGKEDGKVLGWLTDSLINRFLTVGQ